MPGLNNWMTYSYSNKGAECSFDFSNLTIMNKSDAIDYNVKCIVEKYDNLFVSFSGGIDSEFVVKSLYERNIAFTPIIVDFILNSAEVWYAYKWCYDHNIVPYVIKLSLNEVHDKFSRLAIKYNTAFISALDFVVLEYVESVNGHLLNSTFNPFNREDCFSDELKNVMSQSLDSSTYDFALDFVFPQKHPYSFLSYTPEMCYNIIKEIDYEKPVQLALCDYYGVLPRPKIPFILNIALAPELVNLCRTINTSIDIWTFDLGDKTDFLNKCENKQVLDFSTFTRKKEQKCQKL
jgi:hypothetical protein